MNLKRTLWVLGFIFLSVVFAQAEAFAQSSDLSAHLGTLLPAGISGVTETQPIFGFRYALPMNFASLESGFERSHAKGVDWNDVSFALRAEVNGLPNFTNLFYGGLDLTYYRPSNSSSHKFSPGALIGTALMMKMGEKIWLRGDMKYQIKPGGSLYIGVGLLYRP